MPHRTRATRTALLLLGILAIGLLVWFAARDGSDGDLQLAASSDPEQPQQGPLLNAAGTTKKKAPGSDPTAPRPVADATVPVEVRDVRTNDVVPGIALAFRPDHGPLKGTDLHATSDAQGRVLIPKQGPMRIRPVDARWVAAAPGGVSHASVLAAKTIYLLPSVVVSVDLELVDMREDEYPEVHVLLIRPPDIDSPRKNPYGYAHDERALSRMGWSRILMARVKRNPAPGTRFLPLGADGRAHLDLRLPALKGYMLLARTAGWRADTVRFGDETPASRPVALRLTRAHLLRGLLTDQESRPLPNVEVRMHALVRRSDGRFPWKRAQDQDLGFGILIKNHTGEGGLSIEITDRTDERGRFEIAFPLDGYSARLVARPRGHAPARHALKAVKTNDKDIHLVARRGDGAAERVTLKHGGKTVPNVAFWLVDITDEHRQEQSKLKTDEAGTFAPAGLETDRIYSIVLNRRSPPLRAHGCFIWSGQSVLDFSQLASNPDDLR